MPVSIGPCSERRDGAAHLGRTNPLAPEELDAVSQRCMVIAERITAAVLPDWDSPRRIRELSASRMPGEHEPAHAHLTRPAHRPTATLPSAVALGVLGSPAGQPGPEYFALQEHVSIMILTTAWPDRPSDPADEPVIERLMAAARGSESRMAELLLAEDPYVLTGADLPGVISLHGRRGPSATRDLIAADSLGSALMPSSPASRPFPTRHRSDQRLCGHRAYKIILSANGCADPPRTRITAK